MAQKFLVFDVESVGLHGEGFAYGYVVVSTDCDAPIEYGVDACNPDAASGTDANRAWIAANVPALPYGCETPRQVRRRFWAAWRKWQAEGAVLVADCCWPVEARFLAACVDDDPAEREWQGPYPLHDLASVMLAHGRDPLATNERRPHELPAHHPLNDAMQSARLLLECLRAREPVRDIFGRPAPDELQDFLHELDRNA